MQTQDQEGVDSSLAGPGGWCIKWQPGISRESAPAAVDVKLQGWVLGGTGRGANGRDPEAGEEVERK